MKKLIFILVIIFTVACVKQYPYTIKQEPSLVVNANVKANMPIEVYVCGIGDGRVDSLDASIVVNNIDTLKLQVRGNISGFAYLYKSQECCVSGDSLELLIQDNFSYYPDVRAKTCVPDTIVAKLDRVYKLPNRESIPVNDLSLSKYTEDSLCVFECHIGDLNGVDNCYNIYCYDRGYEHNIGAIYNGSFDPIFKDKRITTSLKGNAIGFSGVITDELFDGKDYGFSIYTRSRDGSSEAIKNNPDAFFVGAEPKTYRLVIQHINGDYYRYLKWMEAALCALKDIFANPMVFSSIESNIEGGYGFFSACASVLLKGDFVFYTWATMMD